MDNADALAKIAVKLAEAEAEIAKINADAERRAAPFRAQIERLKIAAEVVGDLAGPVDVVIQTPSGTIAVETKAPKASVKRLIAEELARSALPLSRAEFVERFKAAGKEVLDATVGSTLSNMRRDGELIKEGNRYGLPSTENSIQREEGSQVRATH
jgi:hypothetical protein